MSTLAAAVPAIAVLSAPVAAFGPEYLNTKASEAAARAAMAAPPWQAAAEGRWVTAAAASGVALGRLLRARPIDARQTA